MEPSDKQAFAEGLSDLVESVPPERLGSAIEEFGWLDLLAEDADDAVEIVFPLVGRHLITLPLLDDVIVQAAGLQPGPDTAVVYPALGSTAPTSQAEVGNARLTVQVKGIVQARETAPDTVVMPVLVDGRPGVVSGPWGADWPSRGQGIDADQGWAPIATSWTVESAEALLGQDAWISVRSAAHRALAFQMTAMGEAMLRLAVEHTSTREQFGQKLTDFQVVRHKLADVRVAQETATLATQAAQEQADPITALLAKSLAGRLLEAARLNCQQLLGGMGFTSEHAFHGYMRRALVLEQLCGSTSALRAELGTTLAKESTIPRLVSL
jgi:hypothetical protein